MVTIDAEDENVINLASKVRTEEPRTPVIEAKLF